MRLLMYRWMQYPWTAKRGNNMILHLLLLAFVSLPQGFTLDATAHHVVEIRLSADSVRTLVHRIATLTRFMPGVVAIDPQADGWFLYRTEREIPFSGTMRTDFRIVKTDEPDGTVTYRTPGTEEGNWMSFRLAPVSSGSGTTLLSLRLRVRLVRALATDIHLLAPLLGEDYLSKRMEEDLSSMLQLFGDRLAGQGLPLNAAGF